MQELVSLTNEALQQAVVRLCGHERAVTVRVLDYLSGPLRNGTGCRFRALRASEQKLTRE